MAVDERAALIKRAGEMYDAGSSVRQIGESIGRSYAGTHYLLRAAGVKFRSRGGSNNPYGNLGKTRWLAKHEAQAGGAGE